MSLVECQFVAYLSHGFAMGDGQSLTQSSSMLRQLCVDAIGQFIHEVGASRMQGIAQLVVGGIGFGHKFMEHYGITPTEYRKLKGKES